MGAVEVCVQVDTREQRAWTFASYPAIVTVGKLNEGDYAALIDGVIVGLVERKSGSDLIGSLTHGRERFERELARLKSSGVPACIIVEESLENVCNGIYRSEAHPASVVNSCISFFPKYGVPVFFANSVEGAEYQAYHFLKFCVKYSQF